MDQQTIQLIAEALKEEGINLVVTMPEEPTYPLTDYLSKDPYFSTITVSAEGHGLALCAGASVGGRKCIFVTGIAGLLVGSWALAQIGLLYGIPTLILASYRGDIGDRSGISGPQLFMFQQVAKPLLEALHVPFVVVERKDTLKRKIRDTYFACEEYETPIVMLLTGEVLW